MIVRLLAFTHIVDDDDDDDSDDAMYEAGWRDHDPRDEGEDVLVATYADPDILAEFAGRLCYQSWDRPNPGTAGNRNYLANIIRQQHFSVLEHASATFYVAGVSRSLSHELVRHRHLSFSQLSQRYVDESNAEIVYPPAMSEDEQDHLNTLMPYVKRRYHDVISQLEARGLTRKQARQAARSVLLNATETKFVVTGNLRAWRDVIARRISPHADAEMQLLATQVLLKLRVIAPNSFQDMY